MLKQVPGTVADSRIPTVQSQHRQFHRHSKRRRRTFVRFVARHEQVENLLGNGLGIALGLDPKTSLSPTTNVSLVKPRSLFNSCEDFKERSFMELLELQNVLADARGGGVTWGS